MIPPAEEPRARRARARWRSRRPAETKPSTLGRDSKGEPLCGPRAWRSRAPPREPRPRRPCRVARPTCEQASSGSAGPAEPSARRSEEDRHEWLAAEWWRADVACRRFRANRKFCTAPRSSAHARKAASSSRRLPLRALGERSLESLSCEAQATVDRIQIDPQGGGDLGSRHPFDVRQVENHALRLVELVEKVRHQSFSLSASYLLFEIGCRRVDDQA